MKLRKSLRFKLLGCMLAISILPVLIIFAFTLNNNSRFYENQVMEAGNNEVESIINRMDGIVENLKELLTAMIFSTYDNESCMLDICSQEAEGLTPTPYQRLINYRKFEYVTNNLIGTQQYVEGVYLFNENGYVYSFVKNREQDLEKNYQEEDWYRKLQNSSNLEVMDIYRNEKIPDGRLVMACCFSGGKGKSVLAVICNDAIFDQISSSSMPGGNSFILNEEGNLIYGTQDKGLSEEDKEEIKKNEKGILRYDDHENSYVYGTLKTSGWKIVAQISFQSMNALYQKNSAYLSVIIVVILFFVTLLMFWIEKTFLSPLVNLSKIMRQTVEKDMQLEYAQKNREDEIGILYRGYEKMIMEINSLIQEKYVSEIKYLNSKLQNLMSQINAHFIFNTLENISSLAFMENNRQIAIMSKSLGDMLHYSIKYETDEETLETEINHIMQYIRIQEIRFGNHIQLRQEIEAGMENAKVLKFMLQPIIENAIEHGLAEEDIPWIIWISACRREDRLIVSVQDNGVGIGTEELSNIKRHIQENETTSGDSRYVSIGLSNIHKRIRLLYSEEYGLDIESPEGEGTKIIIELPYH